MRAAFALSSIGQPMLRATATLREVRCTLLWRLERATRIDRSGHDRSHHAGFMVNIFCGAYILGPGRTVFH